jgi:hypothetical protein
VEEERGGGHEMIPGSSRSHRSLADEAAELARRHLDQNEAAANLEKAGGDQAALEAAFRDLQKADGSPDAITIVARAIEMCRPA